MITTKTTGVCDRCKNEVDTDFYTLTINPEKNYNKSVCWRLYE
jgi:hypothetical protein